MTSPTTLNADLLSEYGALSEVERLARARAAGDAESVLIALAEQCERLSFADVNRALEASAWVVELADELGGARGRARALRAHSQACAYAGRLDEALAACDAAATLAADAGLTLEVARAQAGKLHPLGLLGRYADAIQVGEQSRAAFVAAGERALAGRADINLGGIQQRSGRPQSALAHFDRARAALHDDALMLGFIENNRGEALLLLHDFDGATSAFRASLDASQRAQASLAAAIAEGNLADLAARRGDLQNALLHFERARRRFEADSADSHLARLLAEQAEALEYLGLAEEARQTYADVLPRLERLGLAYEIARARTGKARALARLNAVEEAERELAQAAGEFEILGHAAARARVNLFRARLARRRGALERARELLDSAEPLIAPRSVDRVGLLQQRARLALQADDLAAAAPPLDEALQLAGELGLSPLQAELHHTRGELRLRSGQRQAALADFRAAIERIEHLRGSLQADRFRAAYFGEQEPVYEDFIAALLENDDASAVAEAFDTAERARSRSLLDLVRGTTGSGGSGADAGDESLRAQAQRLRLQLNALFSQLMRDDGSGGPLDATWREAVQAREEQLAALEARLDSTRARGDLLAVPRSLREVQDTLAPTDALVEYFAVGGRMMAFVVSRDDTHVVRGLGRVEDAADLVDSIRFQIARATRPGALDGARAGGLLRDIRRELLLLHESVLAPLLDLIGNRARWIIAPHGPLHAAPLHALWDGAHYICEKAEVVYISSASLHCAPAAGTAPDAAARRAALVVGVSDEHAPQIEREAREIAHHSLAGSTLLLGSDATISAVKQLSGAASVLHLACHGWYSSRNPLSSGLKLTDGWLTVRDVCELRLTARLVTLSGCETGRSRVTAGNELFGLLRGFLAAGAQSILASLWLAGDRVTAEMMPRFYDLWMREPGQGGPSAALRRVQLETLARRPHPADWAPFILVGRP